MSQPGKLHALTRVLAILAVIAALVLGISVGVGIAVTRNIASVENFSEFNPALPTKILDIKGRLITEFFADEKREMVALKELPQHLVDAIITREDQDFWKHRGFSILGIFRAAWGVITHKSLGGGSTITQQLAGDLYADRKEISLRRKVVELWWALQLERRFTKQEILEMYLNRMIMGPGVYGVEAASKFYFGHSAREITLAESVILVIQLSSPTKYNPFRNPNNARARSHEVLDQMIKLGYCTRKQADESFDAYWDNYDYTRVATGAFFSREDKSPWFSEHVRRELEGMLYGSLDLYKDGFTVYTTLDLDKQNVADRLMAQTLDRVNKEFQASSSLRFAEADRTWVPLVELIGLSFNLNELFVSQSKVRSKAMSAFRGRINPTVDAMSLLFDIPDLKVTTKAGYDAEKTEIEKATVECALITIENDTGRIVSMIGGSRYDASNQLIRATQAKLMPGSAFKPLMYSAALDTRKFTEGTMIVDGPVVFPNEDGTTYVPLNYSGKWNGQLLMWKALALSLNIPSIKILDAIGFDATITRSASLLGITDPAQIRATFPRYYPLALGVISISPMQLARAFSIFSNSGKEVTPISIISIEDRNGRILLEPEKSLRVEQKRKGTAIQVISPQTAYLMVDMLKRVISAGTLFRLTQGGKLFTYKTKDGKDFTLPSCGKTGTTQNWADAWTVGFTPYMTTAIWFGFDRAGNSLGISQYGEATAGVLWASYMYEIHKGLEPRDFSRPQAGIVSVNVCKKSGLIPTEFCNEGVDSLLFLEGTAPTSYCDLHQSKSAIDSELQSQLEDRASAYSGAADSGLSIDSELEEMLKQAEAAGNEGTPTELLE
ncbi:MAG: PBP1A family penicillin-binding protein [Spirochaetes bacterium]|nr:PBP1A family penicillin-binding protein [Spirochaetota bacterium]